MEFVEGWTIVQTLGEGAYGEVKLLMNKVSGDMVAMKVVELGEEGEAGGAAARESVRKEVAIHRALSHPHVVRYFGRRREPGVEYIFLEYAPNGELFDRIEPDTGMRQWEAQKYLKQLLSGVQYLHSRGVAHRDLKPENLLLDANDNIKISDFGMATIFRVAGKERALDKKCGTLPYVAPEVLKRPYAAEPADIWSCGIVLVAMLAGELPWDEASEKCAEFVSWSRGRSSSVLGSSPWSKLDTLALALVRRVLAPLPSARLSVQAILDHKWTRRELDLHEPLPHPRQLVALGEQEESGCWSSQPVFAISSPQSPQLLGPPRPLARAKRKRGPEEGEALSFSQPALIQDLLISTQQIYTQSPSTQNSLQKLVRRMTRFFVKSSVEETLEELKSVLTKLKLAHKKSHLGIVTVSTVDKRKSPLVFKVTLLEMEEKTLVDFRLSKGCGLEFKRRFILVRDLMANSLVPPPPLTPLSA